MPAPTRRGRAREDALLLARRADRSLSIVELERLDAHLAECWACRAPVARFKAAERAYRDPPEETLPPQTAASIVAALANAVPIDSTPAAAASVAASNGRAEQGERALDPDATPAFVIGKPTAVDRVPGVPRPAPDGTTSPRSPPAVRPPCSRPPPRSPEGARIAAQPGRSPANCARAPGPAVRVRGPAVGAAHIGRVRG